MQTMSISKSHDDASQISPSGTSLLTVKVKRPSMASQKHTVCLQHRAAQWWNHEPDGSTWNPVPMSHSEELRPLPPVKRSLCEERSFTEGRPPRVCRVVSPG